MSAPDPIPFNRPRVEGRELEYLEDSVRSGHSAANGRYSQAAAEILREETGGAEVLLTTSCTTALEMSALLLDISPGDVVIVPSFTFVSSALAFAREGARLLFCDIEPTTLGPDPEHVAALLADPEHGPAVRAVVTVHYAGVAGDLDRLQAVLADRPDVALVEDAAHALFGRWRGQRLGSVGRFATLSFHETKNIVCGEGGALVLNDPADVDRAWVMYDKGTNRRAFFQGEVDKYTWRDTGSSFGLADTLAAQLLGQLEQRAEIQRLRRGVYEGYQAALAEPAAEVGITLPTVREHADPAYHLYHVLLPTAAMRPDVIADLADVGIKTTFHYVPLHDSEGGRKFQARPGECPVAVDLSSRLLRLPFHNGLTKAQVQRVAVELVASVRRRS